MRERETHDSLGCWVKGQVEKMSDEPQQADQIDDPDILEEARSPLSGMGSAMSAGASLLETAQSMMARKARRGVKIELPA